KMCCWCDTTNNRFAPLHNSGRTRCPVLSRTWRGRCIHLEWEVLAMQRTRNGVALQSAGAFGLGAGLMFLLDPDRGRKRRARLRDQAVRAVHAAQDAARGRTMD